MAKSKNNHGVRRYRTRARHWLADIPLGRDPQGKYRRRSITICPHDCPDSAAHSKIPQHRAANLTEAIKIKTLVTAEWNNNLGGYGYTLNDVIREWLNDTDHALATLQSYEGYIGRYIHHQIGQHRFAEMRQVHITDWLRWLTRTAKTKKGTPLSTNTANQILAIVKGASKYGRSKEWTTTNPCLEVSQVKTRAAKVKVPEVEDVRLLIRWCLDNNKDLLAFLIWLTLYTGGRRGEVAALRWRDIDFQRGILTIEHSVGKIGELKSTKTHSTRELTISPVAQQWLQRWQQTQLKAWQERSGIPYRTVDPDWHLIPSPHTPTKPHSKDALTKQIKDATAVAQCQDRVWLQGLRKLTATLGHEAGHDMQQRLGHASKATTDNIYLGQTTAAEIAVSETMGQIVGDLYET